MQTRNRLLSTAAAFALVALTIGAPGAAAQSVESSSVATVEAREYVGAWTIALESPQGAFTMGVNIKDANGRLAAEVTAAMGGNQMTNAVQRITKADGGLVLSYLAEFQGTQVPVAITLKPEANAWKASVSFAGGQFMLDGSVKKE